MGRARRRARVTELALAGKTTREAEDILREEGFDHVDHNTIARDLQNERVRLAERTQQTMEQHRDQQHAKLLELECFVTKDADMSDPEAVTALLSIHDRIARLCGLNLERSSVNLAVNVEQDAHSLEGYARFKAATKFIHEPRKWERIWEFIAELGPDPINLTMPPSPEPKQLSEGPAEGEPEDGPEQPHGGGEPCD